MILDKEKLQFKNLALEKDAVILKMKAQIAADKLQLKEKEDQLSKLKNRHQAEIKKIEYQHQVKFSQLSKTERHKLKKLEEADVIDAALNQAKAEQEDEQRKKFLEQEANKKYKKNPKVDQSAKILNEKEDPQIDMEFHKMIE